MRAARRSLPCSSWEAAEAASPVAEEVPAEQVRRVAPRVAKSRPRTARAHYESTRCMVGPRNRGKGTGTMCIQEMGRPEPWRGKTLLICRSVGQPANVDHPRPALCHLPIAIRRRASPCERRASSEHAEQSCALQAEQARRPCGLSLAGIAGRRREQSTMQTPSSG